MATRLWRPALDGLAWLTHFRALDRDREEAHPDAEEALFQRSLAIRRELGDQAGTAASLFGLALVHQVLRQDSAAAIPYLREAMKLAGCRAERLRSAGRSWRPGGIRTGSCVSAKPHARRATPASPTPHPCC